MEFDLVPSNSPVIIELLVGNIRKNSVRLYDQMYISSCDQERNTALDEFSIRKNNLIKWLQKLGYNYTNGEEYDPQYDKYE